MIMSQFTPSVFVPDPYNRHYDTRRTMLSWREPEPPRLPVRIRLGRALVRFGRWIEGHKPAPAQGPTTATT